MKNALSFDMEQVNNGTYEALYAAVQRLTEITIYKPMDQRSFPEFVRDEILFRLEDTSLEKIGEHSVSVLFDSVLADGSLTTNTQESLNYIRSFWSDFVEDDMKDYDAARVFDKPEEFLLQQTFRMAFRITRTILDREGEELIPKDLFATWLKETDPFDLSDLVY